MKEFPEIFYSDADIKSDLSVGYFNEDDQIIVVRLPNILIGADSFRDLIEYLNNTILHELCHWGSYRGKERWRENQVMFAVLALSVPEVWGRTNVVELE